MENNESVWSCKKTVSNGCCGYHAFAEVFILMTLNYPQYLNESLFQQGHTIFKPVQDFWSEIFSLEEAVTIDSLRRSFSRNQYQSRLALEKVAPGLMILLLSHYHALRTYTSPLKPFIDMVLSPQASPCEKQYYESRIHMLLSSNIDSHLPALEHLSQTFPFASLFMEQGIITKELCSSFKEQMIIGLSNEFFMDSDMLITLVQLLFKASYQEKDICYYPCGIISETQLNEPINNYQPYVVYQLNNQAHFEYAIQEKSLNNGFSPFQASINGRYCNSSQSELPNLNHTRVSQKKQQSLELMQMRAQKHAHFLKKSNAVKPAAPVIHSANSPRSYCPIDPQITNLCHQLKELCFKISELEKGKQHGAFNMREYQAAIKKQRFIKEELKKITSAASSKNKL